MFPPTLISCSSRFLRALQQNRAQSRLLYLLNGTTLTLSFAEVRWGVMHIRWTKWVQAQKLRALTWRRTSARREQGWRSGRALASHQCGPGSIPGVGVICGLSLLVLYSAPRGFSPGTPVFPSHLKPTFNLIWFDLISRMILYVVMRSRSYIGMLDCAILRNKYYYYYYYILGVFFYIDRFLDHL